MTGKRKLYVSVVIIGIITYKEWFDLCTEESYEEISLVVAVVVNTYTVHRTKRRE